MVNQKLIKYIKTEEAQGYTPKQLRDYLIRYGYPSKDVDEAIDYANKKNIYPPQKDSKQKTVKKPVIIKNRNPYMVLLYSFITLGVYGVYWVVMTTNELRRTSKYAPNPWLLLLMLIPFVNAVVYVVYFGQYCKSINHLTAYDRWMLWVFWVFLGPVAIVLSQIELNKVSDQ